LSTESGLHLTLSRVNGDGLSEGEGVARIVGSLDLGEPVEVRTVVGRRPVRKGWVDIVLIRPEFGSNTSDPNQSSHLRPAAISVLGV
jgi:hypothetical protein